MQRVKAHILRKLEEPKLVEELTKHRVSTWNHDLLETQLIDCGLNLFSASCRFLSLLSRLERTCRSQGQQGFIPTPSEALQDCSCQEVDCEGANRVEWEENRLSQNWIQKEKISAKRLEIEKVQSFPQRFDAIRKEEEDSAPDEETTNYQT